MIVLDTGNNRARSQSELVTHDVLEVRGNICTLAVLSCSFSPLDGNRPYSDSEKQWPTKSLL